MNPQKDWMEHLPRVGTRFSTKESEYDGFCPRCLMTEEEASVSPCIKQDWIKTAEQEAIAREREALINLIEKHKRIACEIANTSEYDEVNMTRHIEIPLIRGLVFAHVDFIRELNNILTLNKGENL